MLKILESFKYSPVYEILLPIALRIELHNWYKQKKSPPTPQLIKHQIIRELAARYSLKTLVETGTYLGVMINANKDFFEKIFTIELNKELYKRAKKKFAKYKHIIVKQGDSAEILPLILKMIKKPAIFWLDAHYSGGITSKGKTETSIIPELKLILEQSLDHILLIDDAHYFNGKNDYPDMKEVRNIVLTKNRNCSVSIKTNIIHIIPDKYLSPFRHSSH